MENYFHQLNQINVNDKTEKKGNLTYLSWAWAWAEVKKLFPEATYTIYENELGWNYHTDNNTCWVKTGVTINGIEHIEYLPVMDYKNKSIPISGVTSFDVNKAIQRSLTKACARHGLGLYIYAGEDLPEKDDGKTGPRNQDAYAEDKNKPITEAQVSKLEELLNRTHRKASDLYHYYGIKDLRELTQYQYSLALIGKVDTTYKKGEKNG